MVRWIATLLSAALLLAPVGAQTVPAQQAAAEASEPLKARIAELTAILQGGGDYDSYFNPAFRAQLPRERFAAMTAQMVAGNGPVTGVEKSVATSPWTASLEIGFRDSIGTAVIAVDEAPPHQVSGLRLTGLTSRAATLDAVGAAIRALPGATGFALAKLGPGKPQLLASHKPDTPLAVGSAFKLLILAELVRGVNAGERKWTDKIAIDGAPLPGGTYTLFPKGTEVVLKDVAAKMISISDNSATDILLRLAGREKVEAMMAVTGVADPGRNRPYLGTLEMFKIKGVPGLGERWLAADTAARRRLLDGEVAAAPLTSLRPDLFKDGKPVWIGAIEWFFSPADLVRVMDWLRRNGDAEAKAILSINPGFAPPAAAAWKFVGYKGGSEPGVLNMTWLLEGKDGSWYVLTGSWNDPSKDVELGRFMGLLGRAAELAAQGDAK